MGLKITWCTLLLLLASAQSHPHDQDHDLESLRTVIHSRASEALAGNPRSGVVLNLSLPGNLSGVSASVIRFHSGSFVARGAGNASSSFEVPPGLLPLPRVTRLALLFETLPASYFSVPGHVIIDPVLGFSAFNASPDASPLRLVPMISPVTALIATSAPVHNVTRKCVTFGADGSFGMVNMTEAGRCEVHVQGHYAVAVEGHYGASNRWWVVGLLAGLGGLAGALLVGYKLWTKRKMEEMERESEKEVCFDTFWVGGSKMPSAPMVRTQPVLENEYTP